jgi:hypothetical protein
MAKIGGGVQAPDGAASVFSRFPDRPSITCAGRAASVESPGAKIKQHRIRN